MTRALPYSARTLVALALIAAGFSFILTADYIHPTFGAVDLRDIVSGIRSRLPFWAIPVGWLSVWLVSPHDPASLTIPPAPKRSRGQIIGIQLVSLTGAFTAGTLLGLSPAVLIASITQYSTVADALSIVGLLVALASLFPIATACACLLDRRVAAVVAPAVLLAFLLVPTYVINDVVLANSRFALLSTAYMWSLSIPGRGESLVWQVELLRLCFFCLVGLAFSAVTIGLTSWRNTRNSRHLRALLWLIPPLLTASIIAYVQPVLVRDDPGDQVQCKAFRTGEACLYQINEPDRSLIVSTYSPLIDLISRPSDPISLTQNHQRTWKLDEIAHTLPIDRAWGDQEEWRQVSLNSAAAMFAGGGVETCNSPHVNIIRSQLLKRAGESTSDPALSNSYLSLLDEIPPDTNPQIEARFERLSNNQFRDWYVSHKSDIILCTLDESELP